MIHAQALDLVKWDQHSGQEQFVLFLEGQSEAVDDGTQDLEKLRNTIKPFRFVRELEEDIVNGSPDIGPKVEEFAVDSMQRRFQEVSFSRVFGVEKLEQLKDEMMVDVGLGDVGVEVLALDESKKEFVNDLDMGPSDFQDRLVFLRVKRLTLGIDGGRDRSKQILAEHLHDLWIHWLGDDGSVVCDVIEQLV
jgi:hypothetical protein